MRKDDKAGNARQDDDIKSLHEARKEAERPAGEFETEHEGSRPGSKTGDDKSA